MAPSAYYNDVLVGAICCREEPIDDAAAARGSVKLYIMTLSVLAAYRNMGIGQQLLQAVLDAAEKHANVREIYLHVHTANEGAIRFYTERFSFKITETLSGYYRRVDPPDCHILRYTFSHAAVSADTDQDGTAGAAGAPKA